MVTCGIFLVGCVHSAISTELPWLDIGIIPVNQLRLIGQIIQDSKNPKTVQVHRGGV